MWTKNGSLTLPLVLERIGKVIPASSVGMRLIVDDMSSDNTRAIGEAYGWDVITNKGKGISDGANTALEYVSADFFISFEQDLLLSPVWWKKIPLSFQNSKVAVASGIRFPNKPVGLMRFEKYYSSVYHSPQFASKFVNKKTSVPTLGKNLDNTMYDTDLLKAIGGFPKMSVNAGVDTVLAFKIAKAGFEWRVDHSVASIHLRTGLRDELKHQYSYGSQLAGAWKMITKETGLKPSISRSSVARHILVSPAISLFVAFKTRDPTITYIHPAIWLYQLKGLIQSANS
ncbi:MAG: glycosyltransferase [Candidatus Bathyarchaeota archaeon]|nr:glycosyltransferase [Candidatus Bathyarchaeota archaeon]